MESCNNYTTSEEQALLSVYLMEEIQRAQNESQSVHLLNYCWNQPQQQQKLCTLNYNMINSKLFFFLRELSQCFNPHGCCSFD